MRAARDLLTPGIVVALLALWACGGDDADGGETTGASSSSGTDETTGTGSTGDTDATTTDSATGSTGTTEEDDGLPDPMQTYGECSDECEERDDECSAFLSGRVCAPACAESTDCPSLEGFSDPFCVFDGVLGFCFLTCSAVGADDECPPPARCTEAQLLDGSTTTLCG